MTHEIKHIVAAYARAGEMGQKAVLASVVALEGSSYRRPGVRMLLLENGATFGAVSGGCVEKEVFRQAAAVFQSGTPRMMTYDGRFRLGCEGILHILLEPFQPGEGFLEAFSAQIASRKPFVMESRYRMPDGAREGMGTRFLLTDSSHHCGASLVQEGMETFRQTLSPCMRLEIFGGEHDAVQLAGLAGLMGWEVRVTVAADEAKTLENFPGATHFRAIVPEALDASDIDHQTAVLLMTHSYNKDLKYLLGLSGTQPGYLGILGPAYRKERLIDDLVERHPDLDPDWAERLHGPAGLDVGAETPQEIGISILSEILSVFRQTNPISLKDKTGAIHKP